MLQHGGEQHFLDAAYRVADPLALEVGDRLDVAVGAHHHHIQRRGDQGADTHQRQALIDLQVQLRLIADGDVDALGGGQLGRHARVGGGDQLDIKTVLLEQAQLLRQHQRGVAGVGVPVEHDLVLRQWLLGGGSVLGSVIGNALRVSISALFVAGGWFSAVLGLLGGAGGRFHGFLACHRRRGGRVTVHSDLGLLSDDFRR